MSEVKGALLGIILAVSVFTVVFGIITAAMKTSANSVKSRMDQATSSVPDTTTAVVYYLP